MYLLQAHFYNQQHIMDADLTAFFFFFSGMHLWECIVPNVDIRRQFWARSTASFNARLWVLKSRWTVFNHVMWVWPAGPLQFSDGGAVRIILASASSSMHAICPNKKGCRDWIVTVRSGCLVILLTSSLETNWCHLSQSSVLKHHWSRASASALDLALWHDSTQLLTKLSYNVMQTTEPRHYTVNRYESAGRTTDGQPKSMGICPEKCIWPCADPDLNPDTKLNPDPNTNLHTNPNPRFPN